MHRLTAIFFGCTFVSSLVPLPATAQVPDRTEMFTPPIDALSVHGPDIDLSVSGFDGSSWSAWEHLARETEEDPLSQESNLVIFPKPVTKVRFQGRAIGVELHPIRVSTKPVATRTASLVAMSQPHILTRSAWGADESLLITKTSSSKSSLAPSEQQSNPTPTDSSALSQREKDCLDAQHGYPQEFKTTGRRVTTDAQGRRLLWTQEYSPSVRLIAVHHTAMEIGTDERSPVERMRALYQYHAVSRSWGDIGYHYVIDETGQIYEGRAGGDAVVGGHAYCSNVGTVGIAMMGNFEVEQPTQLQMKSLQWLLADLGKKYDIDFSRSVSYHGKILSPVVGHRELVSTTCPGYYVTGTLDQVRRNVALGNLDTLINFPAPRSSSSKASSSSRSSREKTGFLPLGSLSLVARPGGEVVVALQYRAGSIGVSRGRMLGQIRRSTPSIGVSVAHGDAFVRARTTVPSPQDIKPYQTITIRVKVQVPRERGAFTLQLGDIKYVIQTEGKSIRLPNQSTSSMQTYVPNRSSAQAYIPRSSSPSLSSASSVSSDSSASSIRIRLTSRESGATSCDSYNLSALQRQYRGSVTCSIVDGVAALVNELPLEDYMLGLAEEPDTEPFEKQKAFAVAARTYAAWYMEEANRKFPGKPYDGSDSPATFQHYTGLTFERDNPRWLQAVNETGNMILTRNGQIMKPPYFSSDDGRTRSPAEVGWSNFPFAEIFSSKSDPWCDGMELRGHGVGMSGCGAEGQANEGKSYLEILKYYYPGTMIVQ
ncbi:MAG: N-acetylmuramoyl-L-alanine amidase [Candidatus Peribacteraceae bacterium]